MADLEAQVTALKLRAIAAHEAVWRAMRSQPHPALADDGEVHEVIHAILAVETESVIAPDEWKAFIERQDRRIERLEADLAVAEKRGRIAGMREGRRLADDLAGHPVVMRQPTGQDGALLVSQAIGDRIDAIERGEP